MQDRKQPSVAFEAGMAAVRRFGQGALVVVERRPTPEMLEAGATAGGIDAETAGAVFAAMVERSPLVRGEVAESHDGMPDGQ